jgi:hypothetical protein
VTDAVPVGFVAVAIVVTVVVAADFSLPPPQPPAATPRTSQSGTSQRLTAGVCS